MKIDNPDNLNQYQRINEQFDMAPHWWGKLLLAVAYGIGFSAIGIGVFWLKDLSRQYEKPVIAWVHSLF